MSRAALMERARAGHADSSVSDTLDAVFVETWIELCGHRTAECPICGDTMNPVYGAHARPVGGRCAACGTEVR